MRKRYRDILLSNDSGERLELEDAPIGFDAMKFNLLRDMVYLGILKKISVEFQFVGDGFKFLQRHRLKYGVDSNIVYRRYENNPNRFIFEGKINQENYNEDRKLNRYKVDIIQSSFVQRFSNRDDVKLNVLNTISMDRKPIDAAALTPATIRGKQIEFYSLFDGSTSVTPDIYHHTLPFLIKENGNSGVSGNVYDAYPDTFVHADNPLITVNNSIYVNDLPQLQTVTFGGEVDLTMVFKGTPADAFSVWFYRLLICNDDDTIAEDLLTEEKIVYRGVDSSINYIISVPPTTREFQPGQYLLFFTFASSGTVDGTPINNAALEGTLKTEITYNSMTFEVTQPSVIDESVHPVLLPHELFTNLIQQINGGEFYSDVFGREDLGYDVDGEFAYLAITKGELLRGIPATDVQISTSFREAFSSYSSVICLGAIITENQIRIDPLDVLFNREIAAEIGEVDDLAIVPTKDFLFNSVKCGYPKNEYEEQNGRDEFNTTYQYTNSLQAVKKELDLVSKYYGDGYGIEFARRESIITTGSKDTKYDDKIFFIDLIKVGEDLISRRNEGIVFVDGIFSPDTAMNLRIAAGQNMLRWRKYLNIPLDKKDKVYFFQTKDKNASLNLVTDLGETIDGQDLQTGSVAYFKPEERGFNCPITIDLLFAIMANPLGLVHYTYEGEKFFDIIYEIDSEVDKGKSAWRCLGTKDSPVQTMELPEAELSILKYGDGLQDYIKYGLGVDDYLLYQ